MRGYARKPGIGDILHYVGTDRSKSDEISTVSECSAVPGRMSLKRPIIARLDLTNQLCGILTKFKRL